MQDSDLTDFFVSYNKADKDWAVWVAWILENEGYSVVIEEWDFKPGGNFALEMDRAMSRSQRTIIILSPNFLDARYVHPEWAEKFADDPEGYERLLVPIMIEQCDVTGLLKQVIHIDVVGLDQDAAQKKILAGITPGRTKPATAPAFPGAPGVSQSAVPGTSTTTPLTWQPVAQPVLPTWPTDGRTSYATSTLELHTFSIGAGRIDASQFRSLADGLVELGRSQGLFENSEAIDTEQKDDLASAGSGSRFGNLGARGITVQRHREITTWAALPSDDLGTIFDEEDVAARLEALLGLHLKTGLLTGERTAFAFTVTPVMMLQLGSVSQIGHRSSTSMPFAMTGSDSFRVDPDDSVETSLIAQYTKEVVEELVARLVLKMR